MVKVHLFGEFSKPTRHNSQQYLVSNVPKSIFSSDDVFDRITKRLVGIAKQRNDDIALMPLPLNESGRDYGTNALRYSKSERNEI